MRKPLTDNSPNHYETWILMLAEAVNRIRDADQ